MKNSTPIRNACRRTLARSIPALFGMLLLPLAGFAQPWTYDFGTTTAALANNSNSTSFFPGTPSGGGTYLVRRGSQGGAIELQNPGAIGSSDLFIRAATGGSTNKFTVANWSTPSGAAYVKFKMRTASTGNGLIYFALGSGTNYTVVGNQHNFTQSLADITFSFTGGVLSTTRREGSSDVGITGFSSSTTHDVVIYANNLGSSVYDHNGVTYGLSAQRWDLFVDGVKISPAGGWAPAGSFSSSSTLTAFGIFAENSASNAATISIDDLEYSNALPAATDVLYHHNFGTTTFSANPYTAAPVTLAAELSNDGWYSSESTFTHSTAGYTGYSIGRTVTNATVPLQTYELRLDVDPGYNAVIEDFGFYWKRGVSGGVANWSLSIDGTTVGSGSVVSTSWEGYALSGGISPVTVVDGQVNALLTLTGSTSNTRFDVDDFRLFGSIITAGGPLLQVSETTLPFFGPQVVNAGPGSVESFLVTGSDLVPASGVITVTAPGGTEFEVSNDNSAWASSTTLSYTGGAFTDLPVYVRFNPTTLGIQSGDITISGGDATPKTVAVSGQAVNNAPSVIYLHNFGTGNIATSSYEVLPTATPTPGVLASGLVSNAWTTTTGSWDESPGATDNGLRFFPGTSTQTVN
ncbi:MAG: hypothetical protein KDB84_02450, partial [Flavobacteriales bacterium]|nr:hypothetical protein [Flavobacteriales bacterium]